MKRVMILKACDFPGCANGGEVTTLTITVKGLGRSKKSRATKSGIMDVCEEHGIDIIKMLAWNEDNQRTLDGMSDVRTSERV